MICALVAPDQLWQSLLMQLRSLAPIVILLAWVGIASAQPTPAPTPTPTPAPRTFVVATRPIAPFVIKKDGAWTGISIDLLKRIAEAMNVTLDIRELSRDELLAAKPEYDVTVSLNVAVKNHEKWDLSHAFYSTGLAIAVPEQGKESRWEVVARVLSGPFLWMLGGTLLLLFVVGTLMWWIEKRQLPEVPKEKALLTKSLFWAAEPITRYKSNQHSSTTGRFLGMAWGICGLIFVSTLTANLSSQFTVHQLQSPIKSPDDLVRKRVGTIPGAGLRFCESRGLRATTFEDAEAAMAALERGEIDAIVYEAAILRYLSETSHRKTRVLAGTFANHGYAFGLKRDAPHRREFNKALLEITSTEAWQSVLRTYLGTAD
jgi:polar amino acid transport system substrate-binding protein